MGRSLDVLLFGATDRMTGMARGLERLAIRSRTLSTSTRPDAFSDAAACILFADDETEFRAGIEIVRSTSPSPLPIIAVAPHAPSEAVAGLADAWLRDPAPPVQVAARVRALRRLFSMEAVARRRLKSAAMYGGRDENVDPLEGRPAVLFVGDATPRFMAVHSALNQADADVVAAFSSYSAFDYLHERNFDAVILNAIEKRDSAFTIASAMRRNARLYHTPVLLLTSDTSHAVAEEAYARGVSDILSASADEPEIRSRVLALAEERRRRRRAKAMLESCRDPRTMDATTGLFHQGFLTSHLQDLLDNARQTGGEVAVCLMAAETPEGPDAPDMESSEKARKQFAGMLRHLLRAEDAGARLDETRFLAVLPFTDEDGAEAVVARVAAIADCTAFESQDPLTPFRLTVRSAALEASGVDTAEAAIEQVMAKLARPGGQAVQA